MKNLVSVCLLLVFGITTGIAQNEVPCFTNEMMAKRIAENPDIERINQESFELLNTLGESQSANRGGTVVIPMVFHVIHVNGPENISKEQIESGVTALNEDFSLLNADAANIDALFQSRAADTQIEFRLANKDPQGNCTDGIVRVYSDLTFNADDDVKDLSGWPNNKYLNIWVVESIEDDDPNSVILGYAYLPNVVLWGPDIDGIVIRSDRVGTIGTASTSRTLTHEVGHYLGLSHTFDGGCNGGDGVSDTPPTANANQGCNVNQNTCNNDNPDIKDNVQNHMDYSSCRLMFTNGQSDRMHDAISTYRTSLVSNSNLAATGVIGTPDICAPIADFTSSTYQICAGNTVSFADQSWNGTPTQWSWTFQGGSPPTATTATPTITYNTPGVYDVTLVASNATGSDTETKTALVYVSGDAQYSDAPFAEGFESASNFSNDWIVDNASGGQTWSHFSGTSYSGNSCVRMSNFNSDDGNIDDLISPSYDMTSTSNNTMKFKYAYVQRNTDNSDKLRVLFSTNCGQSWILRWSKAGSVLATSNSQPSPFTPSSPDQWREVTLNLPSTISSSDNVRVKFEFTSGGGNMLYVDDINLGGTVGFEEISAETIGLKLYPNPTENNSMLSFELMESERVALYATDMMGKRIQITNAQQLAPGLHTIEISKAQLSAAGVYMLTLEGENMRVVEKLVVY